MPVTDFARSPIRDRRRRDVPLATLAAAAAIAVFTLVAGQVHDPSHVSRLTFVNATDHGVNVSVRSGADSRYDLGWVWDHAQRDLRDVADVGGTWTFVYSYGGVEAGEQTVARADLAAAGWRVDVPLYVSERLTAAGLVPAYHDEAVIPRS